jgi:hypothetical protein
MRPCPRSDVFAAKEGTAVTFPKDAEGMPVLKVKSAGKPRFGDGGFEIEFSTNRKIDEFAGFRFYTKEGEPVEAEQSGSSWTVSTTRVPARSPSASGPSTRI